MQRFIVIEFIAEVPYGGARLLPGSRLRIVRGAGMSFINRGLAKDVDDSTNRATGEASAKRRRSKTKPTVES